MLAVVAVSVAGLAVCLTVVCVGLLCPRLPLLTYYCTVVTLRYKGTQLAVHNLIIIYLILRTSVC